MASAWETFVANAVDWLRGASRSHGAGQGFPDEQALTQYLALGLRKEFMEHFGLEADSAALARPHSFSGWTDPGGQSCVGRVPGRQVDSCPWGSLCARHLDTPDTREVEPGASGRGQAPEDQRWPGLRHRHRPGTHLFRPLRPRRHLRRRGDRGFHRQEAVFLSSQGQWARNSWRAWLRRVSRSS